MILRVSWWRHPVFLTPPCHPLLIITIGPRQFLVYRCRREADSALLSLCAGRCGDSWLVAKSRKLTRRWSCPHTHPSVFATQHPLISAKMNKDKVEQFSRYLRFNRKPRRNWPRRQSALCLATSITTPEQWAAYQKKGWAERGQCCCCCCLFFFFLSSRTSHSFWRRDPPPPLNPHHPYQT